MKSSKRNNKGISLIVLVITIIIMIILAGAIILSLNSSGIIEKANKAKLSAHKANMLEAAGVAYAEYELISNSTQLSGESFVREKLKNQGFSDELLGKLSVLEDGTIQILPEIPTGFVLSGIPSEQKVSEGLVIYEISDSDGDIDWSNKENYGDVNLLDVQEKYNQYVWIPVDNMKDFVIKDGYGYGKLQTHVSSRSSNEPFTRGSISKANDLTGEFAEYSKMRSSVDKNGGFYIARYEAGKENVDGKEIVISKKNADVWNNVQWGISLEEIGENGAVYFSRTVFPENSNRNVASTLCYGVQWDATIDFMKNVENPTITGSKYIQQSINMGWYANNYKEGNSEHKTGIDLNVDTNNDGIIDFIATNKVKNIYDMAGNVMEWTMEAYGSSGRTFRGANYDAEAEGQSCSVRWAYGVNDKVSTYYGFRVALYIK